MIIDRIITGKIKKILENNERKVVILYGPRQAGKTTLIKTLLGSYSGSVVSFVGDDLFTQDLLSKNELESLRKIVGSNKLLVVDEAQRIENIGRSMKLLIDNLPITILASGSASFDLANKLSEPLTGRTETFWLYPFLHTELEKKYATTLKDTAVSEMLRFGMYPNVHNLQTEQEKQNYLYEYINNYLYKDILSFDGVKKPKKIIDLLVLLALQVGKEVSISELGKNLAMSVVTVQNYLDVLEKMFVIVNLRGFSRNLRKEVYKTSKYYFVDVGVRNALIRNFNLLGIRNDAGELFENWFIMEKIKAANSLGRYSNFYFWRTYDQQEIDLIEERNGKLFAYECKFSPGGKVSPPKEFLDAYKGAEFMIVNTANFAEYLG
ncbi:MAG: ATP-binding protein [Candidatus Gracilibacteria bacterium]|jgi:hypothetical protein